MPSKIDLLKANIGNPLFAFPENGAITITFNASNASGILTDVGEDMIEVTGKEDRKRFYSLSHIAQINFY